MSPATVSVVFVSSADRQINVRRIAVVHDYLCATGLSFRLLSILPSEVHSEDVERVACDEARDSAAAWRRSVAAHDADVVAFIDIARDVPFEALGEAIALVSSETADLVFGVDADVLPINRIVSRLLVGCSAVEPIACIRVMSVDAARLILGEARLSGSAFDAEMLYLANRFGYRVVELRVGKSGAPAGESRILRDLWRIRRITREMKYRTPRRCPVCFSIEVRSVAQVPGNVVRYCARCKTNYAGVTPPADELLMRAGWLRTADDASRRAAEKELALLRRILPAGARVLEVAARDGLFGEVIANEFDYVGLTASDEHARAARNRGVPVLRGSLNDFVNTGTAFDAVLLLNVLEYIAEPHDAVARVLELLKPGGVLVIRTFDTESVSGTLARRRWLREKIPSAAILYSRSALIELLERSGFEINSATSSADFRNVAPARRSSSDNGGISRFAVEVLDLVPDPLRWSSGSIRVIAKRRAGPPLSVRAIRTVEPTHAR